MKVLIKNVGRRKRELWIDDRLAVSARNLDELEQQLRIMQMMTEFPNVKGHL